MYSNPTNNVEHEADEPVMSCKWQQDLVNQHNVLEIIYDTLAIEEVHGCR